MQCVCSIYKCLGRTPHCTIILMYRNNGYELSRNERVLFLCEINIDLHTDVIFYNRLQRNLGYYSTEYDENVCNVCIFCIRFI